MKRLKTGVLFLCFLGLISGLYFALTHHSKNNPVHTALKTIPSDEKWVLECFFRQLLLRDGGAYVLHGTKPAALGDFDAPSLREIPFFGGRFFNTNVLLQRGYKTWKKYQHLFPSVNYSLLCIENKENDGYHVAIINKKQFIDVVEKNIKDFRTVLGSKVTGKSLLKELTKGEQTLYPLLKYHSGLLGIILGYGRHNAWLFYQREQIENRIDTYQFIPKKFDLIELEFNILNRKLQPMKRKQTNNLLFALSPAFVFDSQHPETRELLALYKQQHKRLAAFYGHDDFLETVLQSFCESS